MCPCILIICNWEEGRNADSQASRESTECGFCKCPHSVPLCPTCAPRPVTAHHCHSALSLSLSSDTWLSLFWLVPKLLYSPSFLEGRESIAKLEGNRYRTASEAQRWKTEKNRQRIIHTMGDWVCWSEIWIYDFQESGGFTTVFSFRNSAFLYWNF